MPYKTIAELPETFNNLPDEAKRQALAVVNDLLDKKEPEASAIAQAWAAIKGSWEQDEDEKWVKKAAKMNELPTVDMPDQEILGIGTWPAHPKPIDITHDVMDSLISAFDEIKAGGANYEPPVKLGHDDGQKLLQADGYPAAGWVKSLRKNGDKLVAHFGQVPQRIAELINAGAYKKKSSEINANYSVGGKVYPWVLKAVSILGADIPADKSISDMVARYTEQTSTYVFYEPLSPTAAIPAVEAAKEILESSVDKTTLEETEVAMEKELRTLLGLDEKGDVLAAVTALKSKAEANTVALTEQESLKTKLAATETKLSEVTTKAQTATTKLAEIERDGRVSKALKAGKIVPAQKAWADQYALTDPAGFDAFVIAAAPVIDLTENGAEGGDPAEIQLTEEEIDIARKTGVDLAKLKASKAAEAAKSKK